MTRTDAIANLETALECICQAQAVSWACIHVDPWLRYAQLAVQEALDAARSEQPELEMMRS